MDMVTLEWVATGAVLAAVAFYVLRLIAQVSKYSLMRCPNTGAITQVGVLQVSSRDDGEPVPLVHYCLLWPEKAGCGQGCLQRYHETCDGVPINLDALRPFERR
ncbi:MAG: hypothetical protein HYY78_11280 [Betaproteobacteria bacterium]|nr:hypothetical protein [Betaproteobacteria bacterium]